MAGDPGAAAKKLGLTRQTVKENETDLEKRLSEYIGTMPFLWVSVEDAAGPDSARGIIERNAIALLSNYGKQPLDKQSACWLGQYSDRERVRRSGLWNNNHVDESYDASFLDILKTCANNTR